MLSLTFYKTSIAILYALFVRIKKWKGKGGGWHLVQKHPTQKRVVKIQHASIKRCVRILDLGKFISIFEISKDKVNY